MITLPPMPQNIAKLPRDERGYPVPWFVHWIEGVPEFRVMNHHHWYLAIKSRCWVCGEKLQANRAYVIGPMCAVNRVTSEPACHPECAVFSARACPFLSMPKAHRREANMPEGGKVAGMGIMRNPGCACLWYTRKFEIFDVQNGQLLRLGNPSKVEWYAEGRKATRAEIMHSIDTGLPILQGEANKQGRGAPEALQEAVDQAMRLVPIH